MAELNVDYSKLPEEVRDKLAELDLELSEGKRSLERRCRQSAASPALTARCKTTNFSPFYCCKNLIKFSVGLERCGGRNACMFVSLSPLKALTNR